MAALSAYGLQVAQTSRLEPGLFVSSSWVQSLQQLSVAGSGRETSYCR